MSDDKIKNLRHLPSIDAVLKREDITELIHEHGRDPVANMVREVVAQARAEVSGGRDCPTVEQLASTVRTHLRALATPSLKSVINATGVIIHTNLGRAPLGEMVLRDLADVVLGYSNLELDLDTGERGNREDHLGRLLRYVTGAQSTLVVNNNAAALVLILQTLASGREVIVSRGELIEIGGSFRLPDILAASGATMVEVGTTNKTRLSDYEGAITANTSILLKAHKSNYTISGFTEEVSVAELSGLAKRHDLVMVYDIGSGLLRKPAHLPLGEEPDVTSSLEDGADLVTFSGDKLLGGPQSGIVVGRIDLVSRCSRSPLMRALRVGKLTISALSSVVRCYLSDETLVRDLPLFRMLCCDPDDIRSRAQRLADMLAMSSILAKVVPSKGQCGGGTLPNLWIDSYAVALVAPQGSRQERSSYAEDVYKELMARDRPIIATLRQGELVLDVMTIDDRDLEAIRVALVSILGNASAPETV